MTTPTFHFSYALAERAGREKHRSPCSASFNWFGYRIEVAYRTWEDHYHVYSKATNEHLASFMDTGHELEGVWAADGWRVTSHHQVRQAVAA